MRVGAEWVLQPNYDTVPIRLLLRLLWDNLLCLVLGHKREADPYNVFGGDHLQCERCHQYWMRKGHEDDD